jgi:hypothetical protein
MQKKFFMSSWIDNMGTGILNMSGPWDEATNSVTLTGTMVDPLSGKDIQVREVFKIIDANNQVMEMYENKTGSEMQTMEIKFTRN